MILVDESHNLFAGAEGPFARDFQNLLLELRSVGVAFLLADQSLDALPRVVSDTPANKIFLSGARSSGILPYAGELGLDDAALRELWQLGPGQGLYADSMAPRAVYFRAPNVIDACHLETGCPDTEPPGRTPIPATPSSASASAGTAPPGAAARRQARPARLSPPSGGS